LPNLQILTVSIDPSDAIVASAELATANAAANILASADADHASHKSATCRNCGFNLTSLPTSPTYCPKCGQETANHPPTVWEFIHEFITHYIALEGKLWKTLGLLFFRPGELTKRYLEGQKRKYVIPLRIYLTASIIFFLVVKVFGIGDLANMSDDEPASSKPPVSASVGKGPDAALLNVNINDAKVESRAQKAVDFDGSKGDYGWKGVDADKSPGPEEIKKQKVSENFNCGDSDFCKRLAERIKTKHGAKDMGQLWEYVKDRSLSIAPYAMFFFMPVFALLMKIVYVNRGMYYGEHLVYALHVHAFTFVLLLLMGFTAYGPYLLIAGLIYYWLAMRRVYGGRWWATTLRYAFVAHVYPVALASLVAVVMISSVFV
jgi:hypothetical protein